MNGPGCTVEGGGDNGGGEAIDVFHSAAGAAAGAKALVGRSDTAAVYLDGPLMVTVPTSADEKTAATFASLGLEKVPQP